jgi:transcriptional regulator with XRE-family HTH domain
MSLGYSFGMSLSVVQSKVAAANRTHVAREVGLSRNHVSLVLSGKKEPGFVTAAKLAEKLGITLDQFYRLWTSVKEAA